VKEEEEEEAVTEVIAAVVMARAITITRLLTMQLLNVASRISTVGHTENVHTHTRSARVKQTDMS